MALETNTGSGNSTIMPLGALLCFINLYKPSACTTELPLPEGITKIFPAML